MAEFRTVPWSITTTSGLPLPPPGKDPESGGYVWASEYKRREFIRQLIAEEDLWSHTPLGRQGVLDPYTNRRRVTE